MGSPVLWYELVVLWRVLYFLLTSYKSKIYSFKRSIRIINKNTYIVCTRKNKNTMSFFIFKQNIKILNLIILFIRICLFEYIFEYIYSNILNLFLEIFNLWTKKKLRSWRMETTIYKIEKMTRKLEKYFINRNYE